MLIGITNYSYLTQVHCSLHDGLPVFGNVRAVTTHGINIEDHDMEYEMDDPSEWYKILILESINIDCDRKEIRWHFASHLQDDLHNSCIISNENYDSTCMTAANFFQTIEALNDALCAYGQAKYVIGNAFHKKLMGIVHDYILPAIEIPQREVTAVRDALRKLEDGIKTIDEKLCRRNKKMEELKKSIDTHISKFMQRIVDHRDILELYSVNYLKCMREVITKELKKVEEKLNGSESTYFNPQEKTDLEVNQTRLIHANSEIDRVLTKQLKRQSSAFRRMFPWRRSRTNSNVEILTLEQTYIGMAGQYAELRCSWYAVQDRKVMARKVSEQCKQVLKKMEDSHRTLPEGALSNYVTQTPLYEQVEQHVRDTNSELGQRYCEFVQYVKDSCKRIKGKAAKPKQSANSEHNMDPYVKMEQQPNVTKCPAPPTEPGACAAPGKRVYDEVESMPRFPMRCIAPQAASGDGEYMQMGDIQKLIKTENWGSSRPGGIAYNDKKHTTIAVSPHKLPVAKTYSNLPAQMTQHHSADNTKSATATSAMLRSTSSRRHNEIGQHKPDSTRYCTCERMATSTSSSVIDTCSMCVHMPFSATTHPPSTSHREHTSPETQAVDKLLHTLIKEMTEHFEQTTSGLMILMQLPTQVRDKVWDIYEDIFYNDTYEIIAIAFGRCCHQYSYRVVLEKAQTLMLPELGIQSEVFWTLLENTDKAKESELSLNSDTTEIFYQEEESESDSSSDENDTVATKKKHDYINVHEVLEEVKKKGISPNSKECSRDPDDDAREQGASAAADANTDESDIPRDVTDCLMSAPASKPVWRQSTAWVRVSQLLTNKQITYFYNKYELENKTPVSQNLSMRTGSSGSSASVDSIYLPHEIGAAQFIKSVKFKDKYKDCFSSITKTFQNAISARAPLRKITHLRDALQQLEDAAQTIFRESNLQNLYRNMIMDLLILVLCNIDVALAVDLHKNTLFASELMAEHHNTSGYALALLTFNGAFTILKEKIDLIPDS